MICSTRSPSVTITGRARELEPVVDRAPPRHLPERRIRAVAAGCSMSDLFPKHGEAVRVELREIETSPTSRSSRSASSPITPSDASRAIGSSITPSRERGHVAEDRGQRRPQLVRDVIRKFRDSCSARRASPPCRRSAPTDGDLVRPRGCGTSTP